MMSAFVFVQVGDTRDWDGMKELHDALHAVVDVKSVHFVAGPTDVIVFVDAADQASLGESLGAIRAVNGVASTDTRIVWPM
jgi:DNA-binding Lrp family transcriptional regulator